MKQMESIKKYILFLKHTCGLWITLHPLGNESMITSSDLITFNIHDNPYCVHVKSVDAAHKHCVERQCRIFEKCKGGSFFGTCYAGVGEFVYPIKMRGEVLGFISVSGYQSEQAASYIARMSEKYGLPARGLCESYAALKREIPEKAWVDTLIDPLCDMLELAYIRRSESAAPKEDVIDRVLRYVKRYHTQSITLDSVCEHFGCSRSYISHGFKRRTGMGFREYLNDVRLADAKSLLSHSGLNVTEIAFSVGFADSDYFSVVFKQKVGMSPRAYRKRAREGGVEV